MGITGLRFGVVATLGALTACNGQYEVGSGEGGAAGESSGVGGSSSSGSGGSSTDAGTGGSSTGGGTGGSSTDAGTGGTSTNAGSGGSSTGEPPSQCDFVPPDSLPEYTPAAPEVVWQRISRFLYDQDREIDYEFPEETSKEWVETLVEGLLDSHEDGTPAGLDKFIRTWLGVGEDLDLDLAAPLANPNGMFVELFMSPGLPANQLMFENKAFLSAYPTAPRRGAWLLENLFCQSVGLPPPGTSEPPPAPGPSETSRQALESLTSTPSCLGCHSYIDPLGFSLEHYDAAGEFRENDNGLPIDSSGVFSFEPYGSLAFTNNQDLLGTVVLTCEVGGCFSSAFLDYAIDQAYAGDGPEIAPIERQYVLAALASEYHRLRPMLLAVVTTPSFLKE